MKELKEQLSRCYSWLEEEPDDVEVLEKVKELESQIKKLENIKEEEDKEKERKEFLDNLENLKLEIKKLKRDINSRIPLLPGLENECMALMEVDRSIKEVQVKVLKDKINEYNKLVMEYNNRF